jgi:chromosome segregation ATPase
MPKPASPNRPRAGSGRGGTAPGVLIDDLAAERNSPPLPPEPVFTIDLVEAEAGKRGRRYVAELEARAIRNARAAAEARDIALEQRGHLDKAARGRLEAEREISKLRRELRTALAEQQRLAVRRATAPPGPAPAVPPTSGKQPGVGVARSELDRTREMVEQQQRLLGERREQLVGALRERDEARLEARRASDVCERAKRSLAQATEMLKHNALDETARIGTTTPSTHDAAREHKEMAAENRVARSELEARVLQRTEEVERLASRAAELEAALDHATNRAEFAASQSAALVAEAEVAGEDAMSARQELADAVARETESLAAISELTEQLADVAATAAATRAERDAASARVDTMERQLAAIVDERDSASARVQRLEELLSASVEERDTARSRSAELERAATARDADETLAARQAAELTDRLTELEASGAATEAERDGALARVAELEELLASGDHDPDDEVLTYVDELEARLAEAEHEASAAITLIAELTRTAADAQATLSGLEAARAADQQRDSAELERLYGRVAELEQMIVEVQRAPPTISNQTMALEELGQLAAPEPAREQPGGLAERTVPVALASAREEGDVVGQSDLRRALLANLSELAEGPDRTNSGSET